ncbi:amino acid ABC transporter permease [Bosea caraganae]|uniref:Glutamate/aspartate import permease protein GltK n=1 Tax=Bosea caraganae TaxID=2763117 RepID=A0A370L725_9HYPH|nr:amino acid ABC transporter permease [Bosea caraganae]RDJ25524.1 amino acid ABC transporter permease [Bosea caraganae]RDJ25689.1 amino acid ABC transporter permease [Bosea caraganae]
MNTEPEDIVIVPKRHYGRLIGAALVLVALGAIVQAFAVGQIEWPYVARFLTVPVILQALANTIIMAILAMILGLVLGVIFAVMRLSANPVLSSTALGYIWFFRAIPVLLQLLLWYNLALVFPTLGIPGLFAFKTVDVMTPFVAALLGLGIQQGAFTAEVVRAGLLSVDQGQYEAAQTLGMTRLQLLYRIIMPQAMRVIVPPVGNEFIGMVKLTSLASVVQFSELLYTAQSIYYANSRVIELLIVAAFWYLIVVTILSLIQGRIEAYYARGVAVSARR